MKNKVKKLLSLSLACILAFSAFSTNFVSSAEETEYSVTAKDTNNAVIFAEESENDFAIVKSGNAAKIYVDADEETPVTRVADDLKKDIKTVTGIETTVVNDLNGVNDPVIIIGTLGKSDKIAELIAEEKITETEVAAISGKWEAYLIKCVDQNTLVIVGSDNRGTIYGTYEISNELGISPWYYFGDVQVTSRNTVYVKAGTRLTDFPDVQYRGLFINDEEKLYQWIGKNRELSTDAKFGPEVYADIFELILRLKGNYFWPAMHIEDFNSTEENIEVLEEYGVVFGTSHCDMLGRYNKFEWVNWCNEQGYTKQVGDQTKSWELKADYDYTIHPEEMKAYWKEGVELHKDGDTQWTVGLRGNADTPMQASDLTDYFAEGESSENEQDVENAKARVLTQVIRDQLEILDTVLGEEKASKAFKVFCPYKEVLQLYNNPNFDKSVLDGVTIMWCDDNHGMVRNTPTGEDVTREGGNGLYYHVSYWAPLDQSYMWMSSLPLSVMGEELSKCWNSGISKSWILNVGDLKPAEGELDYFMRCGWDVGYTSSSIDASKEWIVDNFGDNMDTNTASEVSDILNTFYHNSNVCKVEHMKLNVFEQTNYNEWDKRMLTLNDLFNRTNNVANTLTGAVKDSFYELVQCKVNWLYYTNLMYYYADKSNLAYDQSRYASADAYSKLSVKADSERKQEISVYSNIVNGKWNGFIDPENYDIGDNFSGSPVTTQSPATSPVISLGSTEMGVIVQGESRPTGEASTLTFSRYNQSGKYIDIFNKGIGGFAWTAKIPDDVNWITLSATEGSVCDEQRIWVTINDYNGAAGKTANIAITAGGTTKIVTISVDGIGDGIVNRFAEADGYISMEAEHYSSKHIVGNKTWQLIKNAGRGNDGDMIRYYDSDLAVVSDEFQASEINEANNSYLSYDFYLTAGAEELVTPKLELYRLPTLNAGGRIRYAVSIDNESPYIVESGATDEGTSDNQNVQWAQNLYRQIEKLVVDLPAMRSGEHTLKIWAVDNFVTFDKFVIYTDGVKESALGPDESYHSVFNSNNAVSSVATVPRDSTAIAYKDLKENWGSGSFNEINGKVYIEAEYAMENILQSSNEVTSDMTAYTVSHSDVDLSSYGIAHNEWRFTQSDNGYAVYCPDLGQTWPTSKPNFRTASPELVYKVNFKTAGTYNVWARIRMPDYLGQEVYFSTDGDQNGGWMSNAWANEKDEKWVWCKVGAISGMTVGEHTYHLWIRQDGIVIDRLYMTNENDKPNDLTWEKPSRGMAKTSLVTNNFETDTVGSAPSGLVTYVVNNGGTATVEDENGNKFLRLKTGSSAGSSQEIINYSTEGMASNQRLVVEFKSRYVNTTESDANLWVAMNGNNSTAYTTAMFVKESGKNRIVVKKSASESLRFKTIPADNEWVSFKFMVDVAKNTYDVYVNGILETSNYPFRSTTTKLTGHRFGINNKANVTVDYDDFNIYIEDTEATPVQYCLENSDINLRDPYVLNYDGFYYMYGTGAGNPTEFNVYISKDLEHWTMPKTVFAAQEEFWGTTDFWAPEVYYYNGRFYMFASFDSETHSRGTSILVSDAPDGTFRPHSTDAITPGDWECLDGTLYVAEDDTPYMVFCHEWKQIGNGTVCAVKLSKDLTHAEGDIFELFSAGDASWKYNIPEGTHEENYVTDGPFIVSYGDQLACLWSSYKEGEYTIGVARSDNGTITGNWTVDDETLNIQGGHSMIFETFDDRNILSYHNDNDRPQFTEIQIADLF